MRLYRTLPAGLAAALAGVGITGLGLGLLLAPHPALAQATPLFQSGALAAPGGLAKFWRNGQVGDVGGLLGDKNGNGVTPFAVMDRLGPGWCSNSGNTGAAYWSICLGHDADGNALIDVEPNGGAAAKGFSVKFNGTTYAFPFPGTGNVIGPTSPNPTSGSLALWNGSTTIADMATKPIAYMYTTPGYNFMTNTLGVGLAYAAPGTDPTVRWNLDVPLGKQFDMFRTQVQNNGQGALNGWHLEVEGGASAGSAAGDVVQGVIIGGNNYGAGTMKLGRFGAIAQLGSTGVIFPLSVSQAATSGTGTAAQIEYEPGIRADNTTFYDSIPSIMASYANVNPTLTTNAITAIGSPVLHFASTAAPNCQFGGTLGCNLLDGSGNPQPMVILSACFPAGTRIQSVTLTTVTMSANATCQVNASTAIVWSPRYLSGWSAPQDQAVLNAWFQATIDCSFGTNARALNIVGLQSAGAPTLAEIDCAGRYHSTPGFYSGTASAGVGIGNPTALPSTLVSGIGIAAFGYNTNTPTITSLALTQNLIVQSNTASTANLYLQSGILGQVNIGVGAVGVTPPGITLDATSIKMFNLGVTPGGLEKVCASPVTHQLFISNAGNC